MSAGFNREILAQKLAKLNCSQQSIETLSHWCGFHHRYCRQVVETWDDEFRSAPCERRVALLYLANDIMQTSKKERSAYVIEFMRVIPAALNEAFTNGDNNVRHIVKRLVGIWEDRKLFDIEGQNLNDDFFRRFRDLKSKLKKPDGELLENIVSSYKHVLNPPIDEDNLMRKCQGSLSTFDNLVKAYGNNSYLGNSNGSGFVEDLQEQHSIIRTSIEQLKTSESLRATLITHLKQALNEQEHKVEQVRSQLQAAQSRYRKADELCKELGVDVERREPPNHGTKKSSLPEMPVAFAPDSANVGFLEKGESSAVIYSQEGGHGEHNGKAANVVKKFGSVPDSDKILGGVLSPRANGDNNTQKIEEHSSANKRQKHEDDAYISQPRSLPSPPPPPPPFPHPDTFQPPPPQYPPSPEPTPPPPPQIIPPPFPTSMPPQLMPPVPPIAGPFVPFPPGLPTSLTEMLYSPFPSFTPVVNFPMTNMPSGFPSARSPPPAFQGLRGPFNGPPPYPAAPPTMDKKLE